MKGQKWTELIKVIVEELGQEPFKLQFNVSSFASLNDDALLAVFHIVLCEIDSKYGEECKNDPIFLTERQLNVPRVMELLRVLRYWTGNLEDPDLTNEALRIPVQETVWEIMAWLLMKKEELQERAYLAQFLVKVQVSDEMLLDNQLATCYEQYEQQIELFKETHKKLKAMKLKMERRPVNELVNDLGRIGHDIECLSRKVDTVKNKIGDFPDKASLHSQALQVRKERQIKVSARRQLEEEQNKLADLTRKQEVLSLQMYDLIDLNEDGNPETALNRLEQDSEILKHIVEEKLPRQIEISKRKYLAFRITEENPPLCSADLEFRKQRMEEVSQEIQLLTKLCRSKISASILKAEDHVLIYAEEQLSRSHQKKADLTEKLQSMEQDLAKSLRLLEEERQKYGIVCGSGDDIRKLRIPAPDQYKNYVQTMREKASKYKGMRSELASIQAELGNLSVTKYIVEGELKHSEDNLRMVEQDLGIVGLSGMQSKLENVSEEKTSLEFKKLDEIQNMSLMAKELNSKIFESKSKWQEILGNVKEKRKDLVEMEAKLDRTKKKMSEQVGPLQTEIENLEKDLAKAKEQYEKDQLTLLKLEAEIPIMKINLMRPTQMIGQGPYARSNIERVRVKVIECERIKQELSLQVGQIGDVQEYENKQKKMWSDLSKLFQVKSGLMKGQESPVKDSFSRINKNTSTAYDAFVKLTPS